MIFTELPLRGAYRIDVEPCQDERGSFTRTFCRDEFARFGLVCDIAQCSVSCNARAGTLRGMHYQEPPFAETKLVRCGRGAIYDVIVDIRPDSPTFGRWNTVELSAENRRMVYIPQGFAHGFQTLEDQSEVAYQMSAPYVADAARGIRWDDPNLGITWPIRIPILSPRDRNFPFLMDIPAPTEPDRCLAFAAAHPSADSQRNQNP